MISTIILNAILIILKYAHAGAVDKNFCIMNTFTVTEKRILIICNIAPVLVHVLNFIKFESFFSRNKIQIE